jgi:hypothetical protein
LALLAARSAVLHLLNFAQIATAQTMPQAQFAENVTTSLKKKILTQ